MGYQMLLEDHLRPRHWSSLSVSLQCPSLRRRPPTSQATLGTFLELRLGAHQGVVTDVCEIAKKEAFTEDALADIKSAWQNSSFVVSKRSVAQTAPNGDGSAVTLVEVTLVANGTPIVELMAEQLVTLQVSRLVHMLPLLHVAGY